MLQRQHQRLRALPSVALTLQRDVKLMRQRETRHAQAHLLRFVKGNAHVLDKMLDVKAWLEVAGHDARAKNLQRLTAGSADRDRFEDRFQVQARLVAVEKSFAERDHVG